MPDDVLAEVAQHLVGANARPALTVLVQAGVHGEPALLHQVHRGGDVAERAVAGLILLPRRTGPALPLLLAQVRDPSAPAKTRALALQYVGESPHAVGLVGEITRLAQESADRVVRTAAARALGRLPGSKVAARDAALQLLASDAAVSVRIAALRSAVQLDPSAEMRQRVDLLRRDRKAPLALRRDAEDLRWYADWRDR
jgi:hypothetical protein